jgi:hypothetical protein
LKIAGARLRRPPEDGLVGPQPKREIDSVVFLEDVFEAGELRR